MQSVPITTNVVSLNPAQARCYRYNIKFVSDLQQVGSFLPFRTPKKLDRHNITEILLKVVLNTITLTTLLYHLTEYITIICNGLTVCQFSVQIFKTTSNNQSYSKN